MKVFKSLKDLRSFHTSQKFKLFTCILHNSEVIHSSSMNRSKDLESFWGKGLDSVIFGKSILKCMHENISRSIAISSKLKFLPSSFIYQTKYPQVSTKFNTCILETFCFRNDYIPFKIALLQ